MSCLSGGTSRQRLLGALGIAALQVAGSETRERLGIRPILLQDASRKFPPRLADRPASSNSSADFKSSPSPDLGVIRDEPIDEGLDGALRLYADKPVDGLAVRNARTVGSDCTRSCAAMA